jgi:hypothetical protein
MVDRPKYIGLELPIYDADTQVVEAKDPLAFEGSSTQVVRAIHTYSEVAFSSLKKLLATADEELERAADMCKAQVVDHSWGLIQRDVGKLFVVNGDIMPRDYSLVAEVNVIAPRRTIISCQPSIRIRRGCERYNHLKGLRQNDIRPRQFLHGVDLEEVSTSGRIKPKDWLVDIEPYLKWRPHNL